MFDMTKSGKKLKDLRKNVGKTAKEVAIELDISESSYNKYEGGTRVPRDEIKEKIANYYNCSIASIFFNS